MTKESIDYKNYKFGENFTPIGKFTPKEIESNIFKIQDIIRDKRPSEIKTILENITDEMELQCTLISILGPDLALTDKLMEVLYKYKDELKLIK